MTDNKKGVNPLATGVAGAVIGAAAAAAAIALSDKKNRKRAEQILNEMQKEGSKVFKEITKLALELKDRGNQVISKAKKEYKKLPGKKKEGEIS